MERPIHQILQEDPQQALFQGSLSGLALCVYENQRPPQGLAGALDWYFGGLLSKKLQEGFITGRSGECVYFPITKNRSLYHLLLIGAGVFCRTALRQEIPQESLKNLVQNLSSLKLKNMGISKLDFGDLSLEFCNQHLKEVPLCITP
ncbi:MAG: hypothetical protein ACO3A2_01800 [Bdellovibrionia bacterium]